MPDRATLNSLAFLDPLFVTGGFALRPISYGTINHMRLLSMKLGDAEQSGKLKAWEMQEQLHAFFFIQAASEAEVSKAVRTYLRRAEASAKEAWDAFIDEAVTPFLAKLPPEGMAAVLEQLATFQEADAAAFSATPAKGTKPEPTDPN